MARQKLTAITIEKLPHPESGDTKYWDTVVSGFGIRVTQRTKSFFVVRGKKRQLTTIGKWPAMTLQDARQEAKRLQVQEPAKNAPQSLYEARTAYLAACEVKNRPATVRDYRRYLHEIDKPDLADIKRSDVSHSDPHRITAWKVFFNWCIRNELINTNPFANIPAVYTQRSRVLTDAEIKAIWQYEHPPFSDIVKLCLLTGQRKGEVTQFCPDWVAGDTITIPATVAKNKREHTLPFNLLTAQYLTRYLGQTFNGFTKAKERLDTHVPLPHWTLHDLRRTYATIHARIGTPIHVVEALLNHKSGVVSGVAAIYIQHNFLAEARKAQLAYELYIDSITRST